jgi:hypothetical protein
MQVFVYQLLIATNGEFPYSQQLYNSHSLKSPYKQNNRNTLIFILSVIILVTLLSLYYFSWIHVFT